MKKIFKSFVMNKITLCLLHPNHYKFVTTRYSRLETIAFILEYIILMLVNFYLYSPGIEIFTKAANIDR